MTKKAVHQLRAGDDLGACKVVKDPEFIGDYCGQKNRMLVSVQYGDQPAKIAVWGKYTTVTVK